MVNLAIRISAVALLLLGAGASAQEASPRKQLKQLVEQLQGAPDDDALRAKIIAIARGLKPKPAIPEEVDEFLGQGTHIMTEAKEPADYADAVKAFQKAATLAPWVADNYFNLALAQERAGMPLEAAASLKLYLLAAPDAKDASGVRQKIGALKYDAGKAAKSAEASTTIAEFRQMFREGRYYMTVCDVGPIGGYAQGCNEAETKGSHWSTSGEPHAGIEYSEDGTMTVKWAKDGPSCLVKGLVRGPSIRDVAWTSCKDGRAAYVDIWRSKDGSYVLECASDRPMDKSLYNPETRYHYHRLSVAR